jgi:hypothetical protein
MDKITSQQVVIAIQSLIDEGEKPSTRKIRIKLGNRGSTSTILKFFNQWKNSQIPPLQTLTIALDPSVVIAINKEISTKVDEATREAADEIAELHKDNHELIQENCKQVDLLEAQAIDISNVTATNLERQGQLIQLQSEITLLKAALDSERKKHEVNKIEAALAKQRLEVLPSLYADIAKLGAELLEARTQASTDRASAGIVKVELEAEISHLRSVAMIKDEQAARELNAIIDKLNKAQTETQRAQKELAQVRGWLTSAQVRNHVHSSIKKAKQAMQT